MIFIKEYASFHLNSSICHIIICQHYSLITNERLNTFQRLYMRHYKLAFNNWKWIIYLLFRFTVLSFEKNHYKFASSKLESKHLMSILVGNILIVNQLGWWWISSSQLVSEWIQHSFMERSANSVSLIVIWYKISTQSDKWEDLVAS